MKLDTQKRLAASVLKCSASRVRFSEAHLEEISETITKEDIRQLINDGVITKIPKRGVSRVRANKRLEQRRKGRQRGWGSRKGTKNARLPSKQKWMDRIRSQRKHLKQLLDEEQVTKETYRSLYRKAKGGFFRSKRHINLFIEEQGLKK